MPWYSLNSLIAGANDAHYMRFASRRILSLNDITPDPAEDGIFHQIRNYPWNQLPAQSQVLNLDYYYNVSGDKIASKYLQAQAEENTDEETGETYYTIPSSIMTNLGALITIKYQRKWVELWNQYAIQSWFDNVSLTDRTIGSESTSENVTANTQESQSDSQTRLDVHSGGYTDTAIGSDNNTTIRSGGITTANTGTDTDTDRGSESRTSGVAHTGTVGDNGGNTTSANTFGFNTTAENGVPQNKTTVTDNNTRTFNNVDSTGDTSSKENTRSFIHGLTITETFNGVQDQSANSTNASSKRVFDNETKNRSIVGAGSKIITTGDNKVGSKVNDISHTFSGFDYRRQDRIEQLVKLFENPNLFPFFQIVYSDIDEVMCLPVFK